MSLTLFAMMVCSEMHASDEHKVYEAEKSVDNATQFITRIWRGRGDVIIGHIAKPTDAKVSSRIPFRSDSSFCTPLYFGRKLMFYAHGYQALEAYNLPKPAIPQEKHIINTYDLGHLTFEKAENKDLRDLKSRVILIGNEDQKASLTCALFISNNDYLWQDHGNSADATVQLEIKNKKILSGQSVEFKGLSRIPYFMKMSAPGYISQEFKIDPQANGMIDLKEITLMPAVQYKFSYQARIRQKQGEWIEDKELKTAVVSCDGKAQFKFTSERDGLGNKLSLRLKPTNQGVQASFFYVKQNSFYQLDDNSLSSLWNWDQINTNGLKGMSQVILEDQKLYYFTIEKINGTQIQLLLKPEMM